MAQIGPTLETKRLILRPPIQADFDAWATMMADDEAARYIGGVLSRPVAWRGMASVAGMWALKGFGMFSALRKDTGDWIGRVGPHYPDGWPGREVGWGLTRQAWGQGFAREAAVACMDYAVDTLGWGEVMHTIDPDNAASIVLASRLGSRRLGPGWLPPPYDGSPVDFYGQSAAEWRARRSER